MSQNTTAMTRGGVQALSAAPEAIAKLRHLYQNMVNGAVRDTASAKRIADGLLAPAIEALERATPPAEQPAITSESGAVYAELPAPTASIGIDDAWHEPAMRDFADRTHTLRAQAAPKAAPQPAPDCHHRPPCDECAALAAQGGK